MSSADELDDDIVDLLEVVAPGKEVGSSSKTTDIHNEINEVLDKEAQKQAVDAVFPDPTPVDHVVDPDEKLEMPTMNDLDNLLESLGGQGATGKAAESSEKMPEKEAGAPQSNLPDLDAIPHAEAEKKSQQESDFNKLLEMANTETKAQEQSEADAKEEEPVLLDNVLSEVPAATEKSTSVSEKMESSVPLDDDFDTLQAPSTPLPAAGVVETGESSVPLDDSFEAHKGTLSESIEQKETTQKESLVSRDFDALQKSSSSETAFVKGKEESSVPLDDDLSSLEKRADTAVGDSLPVSSSLDSQNDRTNTFAEPKNRESEKQTTTQPLVEDFLSEEEVQRIDGKSEKKQVEEVASTESESEKDNFTEKIGAQEVTNTSADTSLKAALLEAPCPDDAPKDDVDLHKLDALLDDMLADAPAPEQTEQAPAKMDKGEQSVFSAEAVARLDAFEAGLMALKHDVSVSIRDDIHALHDSITALRDEFRASCLGAKQVESRPQGVDNKESIENEVPGMGDHPSIPLALETESATVPLPFAEDEEQLVEEEKHKGTGSLSSAYAELEGQVKAQKEALEIQTAVVVSLQDQVSELQKNMEKRAADAAAKVIREEIAALLASSAT